ncbi:MAG: transketolase [Oscillospiraceae bacterium]
MTQQRVSQLEALCLRLRGELIDLLHAISTGHPGGSLSCCEIVTLLYQEKLRINPAEPLDPNRDRFVLSKGHAAPMLYLNLAERGFFPKEELATLRQLDSRLQGHPCAHKTPGVDLSAGPLGLGLSAALGMALAARVRGLDYHVYALLGDGELQEGGVWEAAMSAAKFKPGNLVAILDHNGVQLDGTNDEIMPMGDIAAKFTAFGWKVLRCDGHDLAALSDTLDAARAYSDGPVLVMAETVKGKGIDFMEGKCGWHGKAISDTDYQAAKQALGGAR